MTISISTPTSNTGSIQNNSTDVLTISSDNSVSIDTNTLHVDATNNRVGIGTSSPDRALQVYSPTAIVHTVLQSGSTSGVLRLMDSTTTNEASAPAIGSVGNNFQIQTLGAQRMLIDSGGRVTMPAQPSFLAYTSQTGDVTVGVGTNYVLDQTKYNIGGHYDTTNGRFTAPINGLYEFNMHIYFTNSGGNTQVMGAAYRVNGSDYSGVDAIGHTQRRPDQCGGVITGESTLVLYLNANDYLNIYARTNNNRIYRGHTHFSGRLVG